jgi:GT2 family glycosyltransferase
MQEPINKSGGNGAVSKLPKVVVGIVTHNRADLLPKAIASALDQLDCNVQVSVIDDGSTDATSEISEKFPHVEWTRWMPGRGYMAARNHWMACADADYFVSLDDDAWFLQKDEIALAVACMERHPRIAAIAFDILSPDRPDAVPRDPPHLSAMFIGCGHLLRLSAVREVGVYEKTPGSYGGEEKDLCLRLMDAGHSIVLMRGVHVWHDKTMLARDADAQHRSGVCNDLIMTLRRTPGLLLPMALLAKICRHLIHAWKHQLMKPCLEAFALFAKSVPDALRVRRPVKSATLREFVKLTKNGFTPFT